MGIYQLKFEVPWNEVKEMLKEINPQLTDEDLHYELTRKKNCSNV